MLLRLGDDAPILRGTDHFIAANATLIGKVELAESASVWFQAVLRGDNDWIRIGRGSNVQDAAVLHTDPGIELVVGDRVTIGHRAVLHGCRIGDGSLIGIGSTVMNHARIGRDSLVAAHALVTENKSFPDRSLIVGAPARAVRKLEADEIEALRQAADVYVEKSRRYRQQLG